MVLSQTYTPPYVLNYALVIVNARESVLDGGQFKSEYGGLERISYVGGKLCHF